MTYNKLNSIIGWIVFAIATIVYLLTLEGTTSLWDCGEYITTSYGLEVGHPPGAPFFMMLGRIFSSFVGGESAAYMVNAMSGLSSSGTILFMFWTLTFLVKKMVVRQYGSTLEKGHLIAIFGSAAVGSLAYTFTDSFWFSAVEGEVYAMSSFFTALVVWAIFKWEDEETQRETEISENGSSTLRPNRWLIFIAYMIGLSIGVHLLNLLAIPAIAYVIYFKKYKKVEPPYFIATGVIGLIVLGFVQGFLIPKIPSFADVFERFFANSLGLGFNSGFIFFLVLITTILVLAIKITASRKMYVLNQSVVAFTMLLIGYSTFAMIVVRSNANTPLDENNPETLSSLVSYLNREQYGSWPILNGPHFNSMTKPGCDEDAVKPSNASYAQTYGIVVNQTAIRTDLETIQKIKSIVFPLGINLVVRQTKDDFQLSTQKYLDYVLHEGEYKKANSTIAADLGESALYKVSFNSEFTANQYRSQVAEINTQLQENNIDFQISLNSETIAAYDNLNAGKAGEKYYQEGHVTLLPRMYRKGEGSKYLQWVPEYFERDWNDPVYGEFTTQTYDGVTFFQHAGDQIAWINKYLQNGPNEQLEKEKDKLIQKGLYLPTFADNMNYMFRYQINHMYLRYFLWNFAGRQNDIQGYGENGGGRQYLDGNWLSGVKFIDSQRLGNQDDLPAFITENAGYNTYYFLPLILGLLGFVYHIIRAPKDWFVLLLVFLLTGLAIVFYLNQKPMEPRERDYAYAASFYAFAFWIGIGVYALFDAARNFSTKGISLVAGYTIGGGVLIFLFENVLGYDHAASYSILYMGIIGAGLYIGFAFLGNAVKNLVTVGSLATALGMVVPGILMIENWDDHDRSNRTTARDFAFNYLESVDKKSENGKGAILFTNGDNDTFPLWYIQEVERVRTDVRVANMSLLGTDWHINQMRRRAYESEPLEITIPEFTYRQGTRDIMYIQEDDALVYRSGELYVGFQQLVAQANQIMRGKSTADQFGQALAQLLVAQQSIGILTSEKSADQSVKSFSDSAIYRSQNVTLDSISQTRVSQAYASFQQTTDEKQLAQLKQSILQGPISSCQKLMDKWPKVSYSLDEFIMYALDKSNNRYLKASCQDEFFIPIKNVYIDVDVDAAISNGIISENQRAQAKNRIYWSLSGGYILKSDLAVLDILRNYKWDRAIYFASRGQGLQANKNLQKFLQGEGLTFKLTPVNFGGRPGVNLEKMLDLVGVGDGENEGGFKWGNMNGEGVLVDYYTLRMVYNLRIQFKDFVEQLIDAGRSEDAVKVLDKVFEVMPIDNGQVPYDDICFYLATYYFEAYGKLPESSEFKAKSLENGKALLSKLAQYKAGEIKHYLNQDAESIYFSSMFSEWGKNIQLLELLRGAYEDYVGDNETSIQEELNMISQEYNLSIQNVKTQEEANQLNATFTAKRNKIFEERGNEDKSYFKTECFEGTDVFEIMSASKERYLELMNNTELKDKYEKRFNNPQTFSQTVKSLWEI